jgi:hypothetical protein
VPIKEELAREKKSKKVAESSAASSDDSSEGIGRFIISKKNPAVESDLSRSLQSASSVIVRCDEEAFPDSPDGIEIGLSSKASKLAVEESSVGSMSTISSSKKFSYCSSATLWTATDIIGPQASQAFSESSIMIGHQEGLIDGEGHRILRRVNNDRDKVNVYARSIPKIMLRNVAMSSQIEIPLLGSVAASEVSFGTQKVSHSFPCFMFHY